MTTLKRATLALKGATGTVATTADIMSNTAKAALGVALFATCHKARSAFIKKCLHGNYPSCCVEINKEYNRLCRQMGGGMQNLTK